MFIDTTRKHANKGTIQVEPSGQFGRGRLSRSQHHRLHRRVRERGPEACRGIFIIICEL